MVREQLTVEPDSNLKKRNEATRPLLTLTNPSTLPSIPPRPQDTHPVQSVLKHQAFFRPNPHPLGGRQVNVGGGLALLNLKWREKETG